jgi:hypothetical protein
MTEGWITFDLAAIIPSEDNPARTLSLIVTDRFASAAPGAEASKEGGIRKRPHHGRPYHPVDPSHVPMGGCPMSRGMFEASVMARYFSDC